MWVSNHRLKHYDDRPVNFRQTPNVSPGNISPKYLIIHNTGGPSAQSTINWLCHQSAKASVHVVIARDGLVTQLAPFNKRVWHAGVSEWRGINGLDQCSIGIELDNPGKLVQTAGGWQTTMGRKVADEDVVLAEHKHEPDRISGWHWYPEAQVTATVMVALALVAKYDLKDVLGHEDIAPGRKLDPGPAFDLAWLRAQIFGRIGQDENQNLEELVLTAVALNIRTGPGIGHDKLEASPLAEGTMLRVISRIDPWCEVEVLTPEGKPDLLGWVHGRYVRDIT